MRPSRWAITVTASITRVLSSACHEPVGAGDPDPLPTLAVGRDDLADLRGKATGGLVGQVQQTGFGGDASPVAGVDDPSDGRAGSQTTHRKRLRRPSRPPLGARLRKFLGQTQKDGLVHGVDIPEDSGQTADHAAPNRPGRRPRHSVLDLAVLQPQGQGARSSTKTSAMSPAPAHGACDDSVAQPGVRPGEIASLFVMPDASRSAGDGLASRSRLAAAMNGAASAVLPGRASMEPSSK